MSKRILKVSKHENGEKLLSFLRKHCIEALSTKALKRGIESKGCTVNGKVELFSTHPLKTGDLIEIEWSDALPTRISLSVVWEDEEIVAYDKPPGVAVSDISNQCGRLVHRLDKGTSGLILMAKSTFMQKHLSLLFKDRKIRKEYLAVVDGETPWNSKTVVSKLARCHHWQGCTLYGSSTLGKEAITRWKVLYVGDRASLLKCYPLTGRSHQLRVHLKESGYPILGDYTYASSFRSSFRASRPLLHAYKIHFEHPRNRKVIDITVPPPLDFCNALEYLGIPDFDRLESVR